MRGGKGALVQDEKSGTLATVNDQILFEDEMKIYDESIRARLMINEDIAPTVMSHFGTGGGNVPYVDQNEVEEYLQEKEGYISMNDNENNPYYELRQHCRVRRLTPLECERLQGMPDLWTDIKPYSDEEITPELIEYYRKVWFDWDKMNAEDGEEVKPRSDKKIIAWLKGRNPDSARYKALGNGIATPQWKWILKRISAQYERDATMGSLFDGIGSFPYIWEQINGKGSCKWSSEIEPFPIKVTIRRFDCE